MLKAVSFDNKAGEKGELLSPCSTEHAHTAAPVFIYGAKSTKCALSLINSVLQCECGYQSPFFLHLSLHGLTNSNETCRCNHILSEFDWNPRVNQVNGSGLQWHPIFSDSVSHRGEAHGMYSRDVGGGQRASLAFLWCPRPLWRCPPAPFTFEFLSRPNRSVVKYTLKSYEFMNFTQVYLSPSPHHQGESFLAQRQSCSR